MQSKERKKYIFIFSPCSSSFPLLKSIIKLAFKLQTRKSDKTFSLFWLSVLYLFKLIPLLFS